jgi:hypothetical protein
MVLMLQARLRVFARVDADAIRTLLWVLVDRDDTARAAGKQLLCSKTSLLLTRVVSVMLSTLQALQVPSPTYVMPWRTADYLIAAFLSGSSLYVWP